MALAHLGLEELTEFSEKQRKKKARENANRYKELRYNSAPDAMNAFKEYFTAYKFPEGTFKVGTLYINEGYGEKARLTIPLVDYWLAKNPKKGVKIAPPPSPPPSLAAS